MLFEKFGQHPPLNRQAERYARGGVPLTLSTLADQVGTGTTVLMTLFHRLEVHVMAAERLHGDDATVPVLARGQDRHRPALDLRMRRPAVRRPGAAGRGVPLLARSRGRAPAEPPGGIRWHPARQRRRKCHRLPADALNGVYPFLDDGRICVSNNAAELALRGIALGRRSWLFCGSDRGGQRAAVMYSLIITAKMNDVDPQAWLADFLARIAAHPAQRLDDLLPWNCAAAKPQRVNQAA